MKYQKLFAVLAMGLLPLLAQSKELITNRDFSRLEFMFISAAVNMWKRPLPPHAE